MPDITVTITVEKKGKKIANFNFECDDFWMSEERGFRSVYRGSYEPEIQSNGHWRLAFKAWVGCQGYDDFRHGEQIDMPPGGLPEEFQTTNSLNGGG